MDAAAKIDEIVQVVEGARAMPMSASCIVNRAELLGMLADLRDTLPADLRQARALLRDRDAVVEEGRQEAERIVAAAHEQAAQLVDESVIVEEAHVRAGQIVIDAEDRARQVQAEVDDYVDAKLARFEMLLSKTLAAVERGRARLHEEMAAAYGELATPEDEETEQATTGTG